MMTQAFYTGISGIKTHQTAIDITSDNLANISTTGFRGSEYEFTSLFEDSLNTAHSLTTCSIGIGSRLQATAIKQEQGVLELTDRSTDLALLGEGWFAIQGVEEPMYTRDGSFTFDANDDLVSLDGFHVLGTMGGNITDTTLTEKLDEVPLAAVDGQEKLRFPKILTYPPEPTSEVNYSGNLGSIDNPETIAPNDAIRTMGAGVIDPQNNKNNLKLKFTASDPQPASGLAWDIVATTETLDGLTIYDTQEGQAFFDETGGLISYTLGTIDNNGAEININLGNQFDGVVSIPNADIYASTSANGTLGGDLAGYNINKNGEVIATFTNGEQSSVGKIAVYHFQNDQGLERINGSRFRESSNSGEPLFYQDEDGNNILGTDIVNFRLEGSNVPMTYGITELIVLQRAFDANSKSITTADQMMQKALNMDA